MERLVRTRNELLTATNALIKTMKRTPSTVLSNALQANAEQISDLNRRLIAGGHETANDQIPVWNVMTTTGTIIDAFTSKRRREEQATTHRPSKRLKPEEAPKFNGTALDYPRYKAAVEDLVTENEDVADSAKARLIYDHLGEATQKRMGPFEQYSGDPAKLLQRLDETFLKGKMITNEWLLKIAQLPTLFQYGPLNGWEELTNLVIGIKDTRQLPGYESRLVDSVKDKLPAPCRHEFNKNHPDTLVGLSEYLESEVDSFRNEQLREQCKVTASRVPTSKPSQQKIPHQKKDTPWKPKSQPTFFQEKHSISGAMNSCIFCEDKHQSSNCPLAPNARYWSIRKKGICTRCLKHKWSDNKQCEGKCAFCPWPHHEWLCRDNNKQVTLPMTKQIFLSTVVARVSCNDRSVCARILLDTGAKRTIITEALTKALACRINTTTKISLSGIGGKDETTKGTVIVSVQALKGGFQRDVKLWVVPTITNIPTEMPSSQLTEFVKRRDIILTEPLSEHSEFTRSISIIIGQDCGEAFRTNTRVELGPLFSAYWTRLGWSLAGNTEDRALVALENSGCVCDDLTRLFEYGDEEPQEMSLQIRFSEVKHRYYVRLPVISLTDLDDNYGNAINQAKQLRDRLIRKNNFEEYHQVMLDYCKNDYAERVSQPMGGDPQSEDEEDSHNGKHTPWPVKYHIPHLPVYKREATKTKVRSVFNASSHRTGLKSLNQCLFKGNVSHCDLVQTLYRIRLAPILLTTDLKKAFLQVRIDPRDRDLLRYFWYEDVRDVQPKVYRMKVALFGAVCSPAILSEVVDHHMKQHQTDYPEAVNALKGGLYVDDGALAAESREQAKRIVRQTTDLFSIASFQLHDWNCSDSTLTSLPTDDVMVNCPDEFVNCLGMVWNPRQDEMRFKIDELELPLITTRRIALSMLSKLFDPLGLVMPFTILLRIFIRDLATETKDWDRKLSELQATTLRRLTSQLCCLKTITIPRHIPTELLCELHVYCDASPTALGAVAYITGPNQDQMLLQANGKLAPRKPSTVPRLELCAAVMCVELMKKIVTKCDRVFHNTYLYSDSQVTLHRIHNDANKYNAYVARRIVKIQESAINGHQWCYVSTHNNPADLITKGLAAKPLINSRLWWNGQRLVRDEMPPEEWSDEELVDPVYFMLSPLHPLHDLLEKDLESAKEHFRTEIEQLTEEQFNAINHNRSRPVGKNTLVMIRVWKLLQYHQFYSEMQLVRGKKELPKTSKLYKWSPFEDEWGLLRAHRRLDYAEVDYDAKFPVVLDRHHWVDQFVTEAHIRLNHPGTLRTFDEINRFFLVFSLRRIIQSIIYHCRACNMSRGRPFDAPPPTLPAFRVVRAKPFQCMGMDFCGPICTYDKVQVYILLATCAVTRAVHLEMVTNMSADTVLQALQRIFNRYGMPSEVHTDNASSFQKTHRVLAKIIKLVQQRAPEHFQDKGNTRWYFQTPRAPWHGGFFERMVGCVKKQLNNTQIRKTFDYQEMATIVSKIQTIINSRPLTTSSQNEPALTPAHFQVGDSTTSIPPFPVSVQEYDGDLYELYIKRRKLFDGFWSRWYKDYLLTLRNYWADRTRAPRLDEEVLIQEPTSKRMDWPTGRIKTLIPGPDGVVRTVIVETAKGRKWTRPIQALIPLEAGVGECRGSDIW